MERNLLDDIEESGFRKKSQKRKPNWPKMRRMNKVSQTVSKLYCTVLFDRKAKQ